MKKSPSIRLHVFATLGAAAMLLASGCASISFKQGAGVGTDSPASMAAADFATNLAAMLDPARTGQEVYFPSASTDFGQQLQQALVRVGFSMSATRHALAPEVAFEVSSRQTTQGTSNEYRVSVGSLAMNRTYVQDTSGVYPVTALVTDTASAGDRTLADSSSSDPYTALVDSSVASTDIQQGTGNTVVTTSAVQVNSVAEQQLLTPDLPSNLDGIKRENMHETRVSSFAQFTRGYKGVYKRVLAFPNDSLAMTDDVMSELNDFALHFRPESDVLSVIGCSHGNTALENGNALLAIGRSKRVRQYLVEQGVPVNRVLDEGCWAPTHFDEKMPRRGVVVELKRKPA